MKQLQEIHVPLLKILENIILKKSLRFKMNPKYKFYIKILIMKFICAHAWGYQDVGFLYYLFIWKTSEAEIFFLYAEFSLEICEQI